MIADKYYFIFHNKPRRTKKKKLKTSCWSYPVKCIGRTWWICSYPMAWKR